MIPEDKSQPAQYIRVNILIAAAFVIVLLCIWVTVVTQVKDEYAKGIITLVLGRFLGYVDNIYAYDFGTTRSSAKKDDTIVALTQTASTTATTAQAVQVARDVKIESIVDTPLTVDKVDIVAKGEVNVKEDKP